MTERRIDNRYLCADLIRVDWLQGEDEFRATEALLEDICSLGACIQVEAPIPLGSTIMLSVAEAHYTGTVCYCLYRDFGYFVGVRFSEDNVWNQAAFEPDHLFNPQELISQDR